MRSVLVTGVAGFIGSNLGNRLVAAGYRVLGIDDLSTGTLENVPGGVEFHQRDIRHQGFYPLFEGVDTVFHLAALTNLPDCLKDPVEASHVNVTGTANVLEAARRANVGKVVYADTSAEYEGVSDFPSKVDKICPLSAYAISKQGGALFCEVYERFFEMHITVVRYFNVYGPAQDWRRVFPPVVSSFVTQLLSGSQPTIYGTGQKRRDFIYVDDVNDFHLMLLEDNRTKGKIYNVGTGTNYSVSEIFALVEGRLKTGLKPRYAPDLPGEAAVTLADIAEAKALGWRPKIGIDEGLERSIDYYRRNIQGAAKGSGS